jgi:adenylylsulfate kinase-like enzyme
MRPPRSVPRRRLDRPRAGSRCARAELTATAKSAAGADATWIAWAGLGYCVLVIIWINGGFGAGKTTLAEELHRRLPETVVCDPEDIGLMLRKWLGSDGDFQHLPSWRELVVATALSLRRHHAKSLIVPMSLIRDAYRTEILGGLADAGEEVLHVFLEVDATVLRERLNARVTHPSKDWDQAAREFGMTGVAEMVAATARQPAETLILRSDRLTPTELADEVLAAVGRNNMR